MTDKEFILNFLDKNYGMYADEDNFKIKVNENGMLLSELSMVFEFKIIIGSFITCSGEDSLDILSEWMLKKKQTIGKKIYAYLDKIKKNEGSIKMFSQLRKKFKNSEYSDRFLLKIFIDYYSTKYTKSMIFEYIGSVNKPNITSVKIQNDFEQIMKHEVEEISEMAYKYLGEWYCDNIIKDKLEELFSEFIIILGEKNWIVKWIGHGTLTKEKLNSFFRDETDIVKKYINTCYENWYGENIIKASEKIMGYC